LPSEILRSVATLAAAASHEINNPLMALIASLELPERTQTLNAYGQARLSVVLAAAWEWGTQSALDARSRKVQPGSEC
jgi:signal transduction histidine kinase